MRLGAWQVALEAQLSANSFASRDRLLSFWDSYFMSYKVGETMEATSDDFCGKH